MSNYKTTITWRGKQVETLADIISDDMSILFVGLNPAPISVERGHYHQGRLGKQFWNLLVEYSILPQPALGCFHDELLKLNHLGITDLVKTPSPRADAIGHEEFAYGQKILKKKIERYRPRIVCSIYKDVVTKLCGVRLTNASGLLDISIGDSRVFAFSFAYRKRSLVRRDLLQLHKLIEEGTP